MCRKSKNTCRIKNQPIKYKFVISIKGIRRSFYINQQKNKVKTQCVCGITKSLKNIILCQGGILKNSLLNYLCKLLEADWLWRPMTGSNFICVELYQKTISLKVHQKKKKKNIAHLYTIPLTTHVNTYTHHGRKTFKLNKIIIITDMMEVEIWLCEETIFQ